MKRADPYCWITVANFPRALIALSSWFLFLRIGPGFSSDAIADGPTLDIISANVTSLRKNWDLVKALDSSIYFLQETTLNKQGQNAMARTISKDNHSATFGLPCEYKFSGSQTSISLWNAKSGGLASIAKNSLPLKDIKSTTFMFEIGRATHTWVPCGLGHRGFHIINCYGYVGAGTKNPHAFTLNEKFLSSVFEYTSTLGDVPWMVVGDLQTNPDTSPVLGTLCASNTIHDLGAIFTDSAWTYQKGQNEHIRTRIDMALCNDAMLAHVTDMHIIRDSNLPGHCPLRVFLDFPSHLDSKMVYRTPKKLPVYKQCCPNEVVDDIEARLWSDVADDFHNALMNSNVDDVFTIWTKTAEKICCEQARFLQQTVSRQQLGRGMPPKVVSQTVQASLVPFLPNLVPQRRDYLP